MPSNQILLANVALMLISNLIYNLEQLPEYIIIYILIEYIISKFLHYFSRLTHSSLCLIKKEIHETNDQHDCQKNLTFLLVMPIV